MLRLYDMLAIARIMVPTILLVACSTTHRIPSSGPEALERISATDKLDAPLTDCLQRWPACPAVVADVEGGHWLRVRVEMERAPLSQDERDGMLTRGVRWDSTHGQGVITLDALLALSDDPQVRSIHASNTL